jgi:sortase (surface protein transpeptidase)
VKHLHWAAPLLVAALSWALAPPLAPAAPLPAPSERSAPGVPVAEAAPAVAPIPVLTDNPPAPGPPAVGRLRIPGAGVDATIEAVLVDGRGNMAVPSGPDRVGWYAAGPRPGAPGDAVLDGHLDTAAGSAVFARLGLLRPGDTVEITWGAGETLKFSVASSRLYDYDVHPEGLFASAGVPRLSLITCAGAWDAHLATYRQRLVVDALLSR